MGEGHSINPKNQNYLNKSENPSKILTESITGKKELPLYPSTAAFIFFLSSSLGPATLLGTETTRSPRSGGAKFQRVEEQARREERGNAQPESNSSDEDSEGVEATSEDVSNKEEEVPTMAEQEATTVETNTPVEPSVDPTIEPHVDPIFIMECLLEQEMKRFRETQFGHLIAVCDHYQHSSQLLCCDWGVRTYKYTLKCLSKDIKAKADEKNDPKMKSFAFNGFVHAFQVKIKFYAQCLDCTEDTEKQMKNESLNRSLYI
ncbi:hypothetical protein TIFTF001_011422 [Ficus carica]|uniref:Uncharacterized protein n=1 Tax=Ficus carica TaxID=3494 RepID=A0AA87ZY78_FICCA|nr:hypothetical protein TIFTF001_011422 [Ficus carica]